MNEKFIKLEHYEDIIKWFESVYQGRPVEMEFRNKDNTYRCSIMIYKEKDLIQQYFNKKVKSLLAN